MKRLALLLAVAACGASPDTPAPGARGDFIDSSGRRIGNAVLYQDTDGMRISVSLSGISNSEHGFHIHETGRCEPPFQTAGSHLNPTGKQHGAHNPNGPHAGDLANLPAGWTSNARVETTARGVTLDMLFDADGSALVVHANPDDYRTDPSGNAGERIACAVIRRP